MSYSGRKRELLSFLVKFAVWTAVLGFLWQAAAQTFYVRLLEPPAQALLRLVGVEKWPYALVADQFVNLVPFLALVLASSALGKEWKRTATAGLAGIAILACEHTLLAWAMYAIDNNILVVTTKELFVIPMWNVSAALPFVLWIWFYPELVSRLFLPRENRPGGGDAKIA